MGGKQWRKFGGINFIQRRGEVKERAKRAEPDLRGAPKVRIRVEKTYSRTHHAGRRRRPGKKKKKRGRQGDYKKR